MSYKRLLLIIMISSAAACANPDKHAGAPSRMDSEIMEKRNLTIKNKAIVKIPPAATSVQGEVPTEIVNLVRQDLAKRLGHQNIELQRAQNVIWNSGAMGCPQPEMLYPQLLVNGYHLVFLAEGKTWDYRMNEGGKFKLCANTVHPK